MPILINYFWGMEVNRIAFYSYGDTIPGVAFVYNTNNFIFFCFHC